MRSVRSLSARGRKTTVRLAVAFAVAAAGTVAGITATSGPAGADGVTIPISTFKTADGSYVVSETPYNLGYEGQVEDLLIYSAAMKTDVHAILLLPTAWITNTAQKFPSMYMLSGAGQTGVDWEAWITAGDIVPFMNGRPVITVLPEDGDAGFYTNWYGTSKIFKAAKPQWETYHSVELPQLIAGGYRGNGVNTIAGISDAGIGVINYPADHPGLYAAAACLSCMLNTQVPGSVVVVQQAQDRVGDNENGPFGNSVLNASVWAAHNPVLRISAFAKSGTKLWLGSGNGQPGPGDGGFAIDSYVYESTALSQGQGFATKAKAAGIPTTTDWWGNGEHNWPAWVLHFPVAYAQVLAPAMGVSGS